MTTQRETRIVIYKGICELLDNGDTTGATQTLQELIEYEHLAPYAVQLYNTLYGLVHGMGYDGTIGPHHRNRALELLEKLKHPQDSTASKYVDWWCPICDYQSWGEPESQPSRCPICHNSLLRVAPHSDKRNPPHTHEG